MLKDFLVNGIQMETVIDIQKQNSREINSEQDDIYISVDYGFMIINGMAPALLINQNNHLYIVRKRVV